MLPCLICVANLLEIAVYIVKMTTSTRVGMFTLAVADSDVCCCGLVFNTVDLLIVNVAKYPSDIALTVSVCVVVFV